jgi:hypothetical protein
MINKLHFLVVPNILLVLKIWGMYVIVDWTLQVALNQRWVSCMLLEP